MRILLVASLIGNVVLSALLKREKDNHEWTIGGFEWYMQVKKEHLLSYIDRVSNSGMGKDKSLEYIKKYVKGGASDETD